MDIGKWEQAKRWLTRPIKSKKLKDYHDDSLVDGYGEKRLHTIPKTWLHTMLQVPRPQDPATSVKELATGGSVLTPKRGLVDGPGSYAGKKMITPEREANKAKWIKANPQKSFENLNASDQSKVKRTGDITIGTRGLSRIDQGIYTIDELAKVEGMPFSKETLRYLTGTGKRNDKYFNKNAKKFLKAFKEAGIERLPKRNINDPFRFKMLNATKSTEKLVDFALSLDKAPQNLVKPYEKEILTQYNKLIKSEKPFSKEMLKEEVFKNVPEKTFKIADATFENVYKRTLSKAQKNKIIDDRKLKQLPRKTIIDNLLDGKSNIKQLAKASNLSTKEVGNEIQQLFRQIYQSREQAGAKQKVTNLILKDYSTKDYQKILEVINKESTLDSFFKASYRDLLFNAIGNPDNPDTYQPKKYARAIERLKAYESINKKLEKAFGIRLSLDHSLSKGAIKTIIDNEPSQFLRVNPIPEEINNGIKKSFDIKYQKVIKDLQSGQFRGEQLKNLLIQKAELEKLSKDIGLPFGKMSPTGKIIKYDAVDFLNKNLPSEIKAGVSLPNRIKQAVDKIDPTVLKERFKVAFGNRADDVLEILNKVKNQDNLQDIYKFLKPLLRVKGLRADASDFLNKISDVIVSPVAAAEVIPESLKETTDIEMEKPKTDVKSLKYIPDYGDAALAGTGASIASKYMKKGDPLKKFRRFITAAPVRRGIGHLLRPFGTVAGAIGAWPLAAYASNKFAEPGEPPVKAFDYKNPRDRMGAAAELGLSKQLVGGAQQLARKFKNPLVRRTIQRFGNLGLSPKLAIRAARVGSPIGWATLGLEGAYQYGKWAKGEIERIKNMTPEEKEQYIAEEQEQMGVAAANGGLISLTRTTPPERGPQHMGLAYLRKHGRGY